MAIDSLDKRVAALSITAIPILPMPDGTVSDLDRGLLADYYGTAAAGDDATSSGSGVHRSFVLGGSATGVGRMVLRR